MAGGSLKRKGMRSVLISDNRSSWIKVGQPLNLLANILVKILKSILSVEMGRYEADLCHLCLVQV